jgi:hypothetical protein
MDLSKPAPPFSATLLDCFTKARLVRGKTRKGFQQDVSDHFRYVPMRTDWKTPLRIISEQQPIQMEPVHIVDENPVLAFDHDTNLELMNLGFLSDDWTELRQMKCV